MSTKLELETWCGKSFQAWKDAANKAGIVLRAPREGDPGDYPPRIYGQLRRFRRNLAITQNHKRVVTTMARRLVTIRDDKGKPTKKEYITYSGFYAGVTHKGEEHHADFEIGKYDRPKIVHNSNLRYDVKTGLPTGKEKILSGQETIFTIEVPKSKTERKKLIDEIIGDNYPENIHYYYVSNSLDEPMPRRDPTFTYSEFCDDTIEELRKKSFSSSGGKSPGIYRDKDGKLRDREGNLVQ